jgi:hypothetical protein
MLVFVLYGTEIDVAEMDTVGTALVLPLAITPPVHEARPTTANSTDSNCFRKAIETTTLLFNIN